MGRVKGQAPARGTDAPLVCRWCETNWCRTRYCQACEHDGHVSKCLCGMRTANKSQTCTDCCDAADRIANNRNDISKHRE